MNTLPNINLLTFSNNRGYLKANAKNGYTTLSINKSANGYEVKIDNVANMEAEVKAWLGCTDKDKDGKPSVGLAYLPRVLWLVKNPKEMEARKITIGFPKDLKEAEKRLGEAIEARQ